MKWSKLWNIQFAFPGQFIEIPDAGKLKYCCYHNRY